MRKFSFYLILSGFIFLTTVSGYSSAPEANNSYYSNMIFSMSPANLSYESFEGTFLPTGWTSAKLYPGGIGLNWSQATTFGAPAYAHTGTKAAVFGLVTGLIGDSAKLVTPIFDLTTPGQGQVSFWMWRTNDNPGNDSIGVWVSNTQSVDGTATWLGQVRRIAPTAGWYYYTFNIPASYNTATNYIVFRAHNNSTAFNGNIYLDDVGYGIGANMTYTSSTVIQNTSPVSKNSLKNQVIKIPVTVSGNISPFSASQFYFATTGSTNPSADIQNARLYYSSSKDSFAVTSPYATQFGSTVLTPNGNFSVSGTQALYDGINYFWLTYDVPSTAISGDIIDAQCDSIALSGYGTVIPGIVAPAGGRTIGAPLSGTYNIGPGEVSPNYTTFAAATTDLANNGISGPVTFNVVPGTYPAVYGTDPDSVVTITAVNGASVTNTITFKKKSDVAGEVWLERRGTSAGTTDYVINLKGADYFTFDSINVRQRDTATYNMVEYGYYLSNASITDGAQYNTIKNCKVYLKNTNINARGIYVNSALFTAVNISGANSYNKIQNNIFLNCFYGAQLNGNSGFSNPYTLFDQGNEITGNSITGFGYGGTSPTTAAYGIATAYQNNLKISYNTIYGGMGSTGSINGIINNLGNQVNAEISYNTVTIKSATVSATVTNGIINSAGNGTGGAANNNHIWILNNNIINFNVSNGMNGISNTSSPDTLIISGNTIQNDTSSLAASTSTGIITQSSSPNVKIISQNIVQNLVKSGAGGTNLYGIQYPSSAPNGITYVYNNTISGLSGTLSASVAGIFSAGQGSAPLHLATYIYGNTISGFNVTATNIYGIYNGNNQNWFTYNNKINNLTNLKVTGLLYGIYSNTGGISSNNQLSINHYYYNNSVSNLKVPAGTNGIAVVGAYIAGGMNVGFYYNSIYLADTSTGASYGNSALYITDTNSVDVRNNNFVNVSKPSTTGYITGLKLFKSNTLRNSPKTWNNNNWYVSTGSARSLFYYDSTNSFTTISAFKNFINPREISSFSELPAFIDAYNGNLRINTSTPTLLEKGALPVSSPVAITTDYDGNTRDNNYPDVGFSEFSGTNATDIVPPAINYTAIVNGGTGNRVLSGVSIYDRSKVDTSANRPRCYFKHFTKDPNAYTGNDNTTDGWKYVVADGTSGSPFTFTIDYSLLFNGAPDPGDYIQYFVAAQDLAAPNVALNAGYLTTLPISVDLQSSDFPMNGNINKYLVGATFSSTIEVGAGKTYTSLTGTGGLFSAINSGLLTGNLVATITSDLNETALNGLNAWSEQSSPNGNYSLIIMPDSAVQRTITCYNDTAMIRLNGASKVTFDGMSGKYLKFRHIRKRAAFYFVNGASFDTIRNCSIECGGDLTLNRLNSSPVTFQNGSPSQGNSYNVIMNNIIRERTDTAFVPIYEGIYSGLTGATSSATINNSYNEITGNEIVNFYQGGIFIAVGSGSGWKIKKNSFYYTQIFTGGSNGAYSAISVSTSGTSTGGYNVDSNYIGGMAVNAGGSYFSTPAGYNLATQMISVTTGRDSISTINGNVIQNFRSRTIITNVKLINLASTGWFQCNGNRIGNADTAYRIEVPGSLTCIYDAVTPFQKQGTFSISNNVINNVWTNDTVPQNQYPRYGIQVANASHSDDISGNTVCNFYSKISPENTGTNQIIAGIQINDLATVYIRNNNFYNIANLSTKPTVPTSPYGRIQVYGIYSLGIADSSVISGNRIYNLYTSTPSGNTDFVAGIFNSNLTTTIGSAVNIFNNQISLLANSGAEAQVIGICDAYNTATAMNYNYNTVLIGGNSANGEFNSYAYYKNGRNIITTLKNNIFYNARTGGTGKHLTVGTGINSLSKEKNSGKNGQVDIPRDNGINNNENDGPSANFSGNHNVFVTASSSFVADWYGTAYNFAGFKAQSESDANSYSDITANIPYGSLFADTANGNLNIVNTYEGAWISYKKGMPLTGFSVDYSGNARSTTVAGGPTCIGSSEFTATTPPPVVTPSGTPAPGTTTTYTESGKTIMDIKWSAGAPPSVKTGSNKTKSKSENDNVPSVVNVQYFSGMTPPDTVTGTLKNIGNGYWYVQTDVAADSAANFTIYYGAQELGDISSESDLIIAKYDSATRVWVPFERYVSGDSTGRSVVDVAAKSIHVKGIIGGTGIFALTSNTNPIKRLRFDMTAIFSGYWYDHGFGNTQISDTLNITLRDTVSPYASVGTFKVILDTLGRGYTFSNLPALGGCYYAQINHLNSLETWTKIWQMPRATGIKVNDMTSAQTQAYGDNLIQVSGKWCLIGGDVNQDKYIDGSDYLDIINYYDTAEHLAGDTNGDFYVDGSDYLDVINHYDIGSVIPTTPMAKRIKIELAKQMKLVKKTIEQNKIDVKNNAEKKNNN